MRWCDNFCLEYYCCCCCVLNAIYSPVICLACGRRMGFLRNKPEYMNMVVKIKYNFQVRPIIWPYTHKKKTYETKNAKKHTQNKYKKCILYWSDIMNLKIKWQKWKRKGSSIFEWKKREKEQFLTICKKVYLFGDTTHWNRFNEQITNTNKKWVSECVCVCLYICIYILVYKWRDKAETFS